MAPPPLDLARIRAITLDLDDTLWPVWPTIERAEQVLLAWLHRHAPRTAALVADRASAQAARAAVRAAHAERLHDLAFLRRELIRHQLREAGDDPQWADTAFEAFHAERQRVDLFDDALPALRALSARYPLVALTNGSADVARIGIAAYFQAAVSAREVGVGKPDARVFLAGAAAAGCPPEQVLHVGDDPALDVAGALAAGMQTVWVDRKGEAAEPGAERPLPHAVVRGMDELVALLGVDRP